MRWLFRSAAGHVEASPAWSGGAPDELARRLTHHRGWPLLARRADQVPGLPAALADQAREHARRAAIHQLALALDLAACGRALDEAGISWACVKGPVLEATYRRAGEGRAYVDLDLLVAPADLHRALQALAGAGAGLLDRNWALLRAQVPGEVAVLAAAGTVVDLHWSLVNRAERRARLPVPTAALLARSHHADVGGVQVPALHPADALVHLCLHAAAGGGTRLGWLLDVALTAAETRTAWADVVGVARGWRVGGPVGLVLARCRRVLGLPVPPAVERALAGPGGWAAAERAMSLVSTPGGDGTGYWASLLGVGSVEHDAVAPFALAALRRRVRPGRRTTPFVQHPSDPGSALHPAGTPDDLAAYLRAVAAQEVA